MEASSLPISESHRGKLISAGYTSFSSLSSVSSSHLAQDLKISENEEAEILKVASRRSGLDKIESGSHTLMNGAQMAWDMLHKEESSLCITTSCSNLDEILGGGIHCNEVTEIGGVPGIGKTQLGIQMVINAQIPAEYGGLGGKAIYDADTEGSFMVEHVLQIDKACAQDMLEYNNLLQKDPHACRVDKQSRDFLDNIFYFQIWTHTEQIAAINYLEKFISEHKDVKVVIIDSITFHFRQDFEDMALRTRLLSGIALKLMKLAKKFNLAVVLLNQVTTKYTDGSFQLTLALGDSWSHAATNRIILYWNGNERYAYIDKSPTLPSASAPYAVTSRGDTCIWDLSRSSEPSHFPPLKETASHVQKIIPIAQSSHNNQQPHDFDSITNFKGKLYREKISSVWIVRSFNSLEEGDQSTAFCIDKRGILLTCAHGILDECEISAIHLKSRKTYNVNVVGKSAAWDMALLIVETDEEEFDSLSFADEGYEVLCGQELHVIGHPEVLEGSFYSGRVGYSNDGFDRALLNEIEEPGISYTCTFERVEGHRRMGNIMPILNCATITRNPNIPFIQISIPAVSGSSGAPAFNDGVVVGMCQSGFGYIQLAIHFCALRHFLQRLKPSVDELLNEELKRRAETTRVKKKKKRVLRLHLMGFSKACVRRWI